MVGVTGPFINDQLPVPITGLLPYKVILVAAQITRSFPAAAIVGWDVTITCTWSSEGGQGPLLIVHLKM
jgi:hypothetical protein